MSDCLWSFIFGVCDCNNCCKNCDEYISVNSDKGNELYEKYQADVDKVMIPLTEKWIQLKEQNND